MYNNPAFFGYNPIMYGYNPAIANIARPSLIKKFFGGINFGNLLNQTSRTLNVINQAIPIVYQVKPMVNNARTMFKIANIIKTDDRSTNVVQTNNSTVSEVNNQLKKEETSSSNQPTFFL